MHRVASILAVLIFAGICAGETVTFFPGSTHGETISVTFTYQSGSGGKITAVCPNDVLVWDSAGGSITITNIDPEPSDPCEIYADLNPAADFSPYLGLNSHFANYTAAENVIKDFVSSDPLTHVTIAAGNTLVIGLGFNASHGSHVHWQKAYAILTVLAAAPSPATNGYWFRPHWGAGPKTLEYNTDDVDLDIFPDLAPVPNSPNASEVASLLLQLQRSGVDAYLSPQNQYTHAYYGMDHYGGSAALATDTAFLWLCENHTDGEKLPLAAALIQYGLDCSRSWEYGVNADGMPPIKTTWAAYSGMGGHVVGRLLPVVAVAQCLGDALALDQLSRAGDDHTGMYPYASDAIGIGECVQTHVLKTIMTPAQRTAGQFTAADIWIPPYNGTGPLFGFAYRVHRYTTGTATFTHGSTTVSGAGGCDWTPFAGHMMMCRPDGAGPYPDTDGYEMERVNGRCKTIASITDPTHLELTTQWQGNSGTYLYCIDDGMYLDRCSESNPLCDFNEPTADDVGMPVASFMGMGMPSLWGLGSWPIGYEGVMGPGTVACVMGLLATGSDTLGDFESVLKYGDSFRYQYGANSFSGGYYKAYWASFFDAYRSSYDGVVPTFENVHADAGPDQNVLWENRNAVQLDGSGSWNLMVNKNSTTYSWSEGGVEIATGKVPSPIALTPGSHTITLTVTSAFTDRVAEPDVHDTKIKTDTVGITVDLDIPKYYLIGGL